MTTTSAGRDARVAAVGLEVARWGAYLLGAGLALLDHEPGDPWELALGFFAAFLVWSAAMDRLDERIHPLLYLGVQAGLVAGVALSSASWNLWWIMLAYPTLSVAAFMLDGFALWGFEGVAVLLLSGLTGWQTGSLLYAVSLATPAVFVVPFSYLVRLQMRARARTEVLLRQVESSHAELEATHVRLEHAHRELAEAHRRLQAESQRAQELAATRERNRLAGEIHDTLAHTLTSLIVQLEAARRKLERAPDGSDRVAFALDRLRDAEAAARAGLAEVRRSVRALRPDLLERSSLPDALATLCHGVGDASGIPVRFAWQVADGVLPPPDQAGVAFRTIQEALTNAVKYAGASEIRVTVGRGTQPPGWWLRVQDDGRGAARVEPGFGLTQMRERVAALGGSIRWESEPGGGFAVEASWPDPPGAQDPAPEEEAFPT